MPNELCLRYSYQADETIFNIVGEQISARFLKNYRAEICALTAAHGFELLFQYACAEIKLMHGLLHGKAHLAAVLFYAKLLQHIHAE